MSKSSGESVFQLISDPSEKMKIIYDLVRGHLPVLAKGTSADAELFELEASSVQGSSLLLKSKAVPLGKLSGELILQFQVGPQKYMMQVNVEKKAENLQIGLDRKLFRIQRREFFRMNLPANFRGHLLIQDIAGVKLNLKLSLLDLSGGGCRARTSSKDLPNRIGFNAILQIPGREDFKLKCNIRHQEEIQDKSGDRWLGIQFAHPSEKEASRMAATVMDLYREYFSRL